VSVSRPSCSAVAIPAAIIAGAKRVAFGDTLPAGLRLLYDE
jgi:hypothetical protein